MRQLLLKHRWTTAFFCLTTMLSAIIASGEALKLVEVSEQTEFEQCEELLQVRRQKINHLKSHVGYPSDSRDYASIQVALANRSLLNSNGERQHINGCGSYLKT